MVRRALRRAVCGGDPDCVHHFIMDRPVWVDDYFLEHGVCKKCGAVTEYLRPEYPEFDAPIILTDGLREEFANVRYEDDSD